MLSRVSRLASTTCRLHVQKYRYVDMSIVCVLIYVFIFIASSICMYDTFIVLFD